MELSDELLVEVFTKYFGPVTPQSTLDKAKALLKEHIELEL